MAGSVRAAVSARVRAGWASVADSSVLALVRFLPRASAPGSAVLGVVLVAGALAPVALILATGGLLGALPGAVRGGLDSADGHHAIHAFAVVLALTVLVRVLDPVTTVLSSWLGRRVEATLCGLALAAVDRPVGIAHLEDPATADHLTHVQGLSAGRHPPARAVPALAAIVEARLNALFVAVTLGLVVWWAPFPLIAAWVPVGRWTAARLRAVVRGARQDTAALRHAADARAMATEPDAAKDVRIFGLADWTLNRYTGAWLTGMGEVFRRDRRWRGIVGAALALAAAHAVVLAPLTVRAAHGEIGLGTLVVAVQAAVGMSVFGPMGDAQWTLTSASATVPHALALDRAVRRAAPPPVRDQSAGRVESGIRFEGVGFGYPGRPNVLDDFDLRIPWGTSVALVGANGAGKTTIVKLLARLYDPDRGAITVDGVDLRDLDPKRWRDRLAIAFQDFTRYELTARENVRFGRLDAPVSDEDLDEVMDLAGGGDFIRSLPYGWDTILSRRLRDGVELSGGQWQRVALARSLFAARNGAGVLVLDEPTAHLDIRAEADLYRRFLDLTRGLTTILISHRFATVRLADRIVVLDGGRVVESGAHDQLVALGGQYAQMFATQAASFAGSAP